jgi:small-conductance mechanosensitive channel
MNSTCCRSCLFLALLLLVDATFAFLTGSPAQHIGSRTFIPRNEIVLSALPWDSQLAINLCVASTLALATDPMVDLLFENQDEKPILYAATTSVTVAARVYVVLSVTSIFCTQYDWLPPASIDLKDKALTISLTAWLTLTASKAKKSFLRNAISGTRLGRVALYDTMLDLLLIILAAAIVLRDLNVDYGMRLQSIFAAGSLGAITFSLASRDLAENIVGGIVLQAWDAFNEGDDIKLGDGSEGTVLCIGLVETELCGYDNIVTMIPNSQLTKQRVCNMSRMTRSRFKQVLRFQYSDINNVPAILNDMLEEIRSMCSPSVITDGSKPFQAVLTKYEPDHIEAEVTCHFSVPPGSTAFVALRQSVLLAIAKAMQTNNAEFALPSINYKVDDSASRDSIL